MPPQYIEDFIKDLRKSLSVSEIKLKKCEKLIEKRIGQLDKKLGLSEIVIDESLPLEQILMDIYDMRNGALAKREETYFQDALYKRLIKISNNLRTSISKSNEDLIYWEYRYGLLNSTIWNERFLSELIA